MGKDHRGRVPGKVLLEVVHQSLRGPGDVSVIHTVGAHRRKLRPTQCRRLSLLRLGHHLADRPAPQSTRAKRQRPEKPVVQLRPLPCPHQLPEARLHHRLGGRRGHQPPDILRRILGELPSLHRLLHRIFPCRCHKKSTYPDRCPQASFRSPCPAKRPARKGFVAKQGHLNLSP